VVEKFALKKPNSRLESSRNGCGRKDVQNGFAGEDLWKKKALRSWEKGVLTNPNGNELR